MALMGASGSGEDRVVGRVRDDKPKRGTKGNTHVKEGGQRMAIIGASGAGEE